ncbi:MAG: putative Na+/H+ antiporter [Acidobacteriota bacterium]
MQLSTLATILGTAAFACAVSHTFLAGRCMERAKCGGPHHGLWHLLGEVEAVFGFWAGVFLVLLAVFTGPSGAVGYIETISFTEPAFVFAIMLAASAKPVVTISSRAIFALAARLPLPRGQAVCLTALTVGPLMGSFITEPAAMTVTALILYLAYFRHPLPATFKYAMLGTLFVNVSIGGVLTHFAAPPVIMCAPAWGWGTGHMLANFGWKAALAVVANAALVTLLFAKRLRTVEIQFSAAKGEDIPGWITAVHMLALALLVALLHHPTAFMAVLVLLLGFMAAYAEHQNELMLRPAFLVGVFLAGLVILGPPQQWWVQFLIARMDATALYVGSALLTAITDNAALTYLGTLVPDISDPNKHALLAGAVTGGGLTVIANAPNPAGYSILKAGFKGGIINPLWLFAGALVPTCVAAAAFLILP